MSRTAQLTARPSKARKKTNWHKRALSQRLIRNILSVFHQASDSDRSEGLYWYQTANRDAQSLAERFQVSLSVAVGVIAALSPGRNWGLNLQDAEKLLHAFTNDLPLPHVGSYGRKNVAKARRIMQGENPFDVLPPTGPKVRAFYSLILDPASNLEVCVDRHALAIAVGRVQPESVTVRVFQYGFFAKHYSAAAAILGLLPHQVQAVTWVTWRRLKAQDEVPF